MAEEVRNVTPVNTDTDSDDVVQVLENVTELDPSRITAAMASPVVATQQTTQNNSTRTPEPDAFTLQQDREKNAILHQIENLNKLIDETNSKIKKEEDKRKELQNSFMKDGKLHDKLKGTYVPALKIISNFMIMMIPFLAVFMPFAAFAILGYFLAGALKAYDGTVEKRHLSTSKKMTGAASNINAYYDDLNQLKQRKEKLEKDITNIDKESYKYQQKQKEVNLLEDLQRRLNQQTTTSFAPRPAMATAGVAPTMQPAGADMGMELPPPPPAGKK